MRWLVPVLLLCVVVESAAVPGLVGNHIRPELALVVVVGWGTVRGWEEGLVAGLLGGLLADLASVGPFGVHMLRLGIVGLAAGLLVNRLVRTSAVLPVGAAAVGSLLSFAIGVVGLQAAGWVASWEHALVFEAVPRAVLTSATMAVAFPVVRALDARARRDDDSGAA
jgi:rod shape-determining protein MreD